MAAFDERRCRRPIPGVLVFALISLLVMVTGCNREAPATTTAAATGITTTVPATTFAAPETGSPPTTLPPTTTVTAPETSPSTTLARTSPIEGVTVEVTSSSGEVRLIVTADVTDQVHVHGYDLTEPVTPSEAARLDFVADIPGVFEVELERSDVKLADLEVAP